MLTWIAAILLIVGVGICGHISALAHRWTWTKFLAAKPLGIAPSEYRGEIYIPFAVHKGAWGPGLIALAPLFAGGMVVSSETRSTGLSSALGGAVALLTGILLLGTVWNLFKRRSKVEYANAAIAKINSSLERQEQIGPLTTYRRYWRACYSFELVSSVMGHPNKQSSSSQSSLTQSHALIDQVEHDLQTAVVDSDTRLRALIANSKMKSQVVEWRYLLKDEEGELVRYVRDWPSTVNGDQRALVRIVCRAFVSPFTVKRIQLDTLDLTSLISSPREIKKGPSGTELGPIRIQVKGSKGAFVGKRRTVDVIVAVSPGAHEIIVDCMGVISSKQSFGIKNGGRTVAFISFNDYAPGYPCEIVSAD